MNNKFLRGIFLMLLVSGSVFGQRNIEPKVKKSPIAIAVFKKDKNYLKVTYGQPYKKGRDIYGALVPYDEIWRLGANEATEITTTQDIKVDAELLKAGTYTVFAIPDEEKWTLIFNGELGQWGAYKYEEIKDKDILKIEVPTEKIEDQYEALTLKFEETDKGALLHIVWDQTMVSLPITFLK